MIAAEVSKQLRRWRTWILVGICLGISLLVSILIGENHRGGGGAGPIGISMSSSGLVLGVVALFFASHLLTPITFVVYFGEPMASEARWGSLRYLLVRPVSRSRVLSAKVVVSAALALSTLVLIPLVASLVGIGYFGLHPVLTGRLSGPFTVYGGMTTISVGGTIGRMVLATAYVALDCAALAGLAVLLAVLTENVLAAVAGAAGTYIASAIVGNLPGRFVTRIAPGLPTHYFDAWTNLFQPGSPLSAMVHGLVTQSVWLALTLGGAYLAFNRKDITS